MKVIVFAAALWAATSTWAQQAPPPNPNQQLPTILTDTFQYDFGTPSIIDIRELVAGCPKRDCLPSIDTPKFDNTLNTDYLDDDDLLLVVTHNRMTHAYPHKILEGRQVVNDRFGRTPIVASYCPLCASGVAFIAEVGGLVSEFGVSGLLHNSDLVLYDRRTRHLWGQITGEAITGPKSGERLQRVPTQTLRWQDVKARYPRARVLQPDSRDRTHLQRSNGRSHYDNYANTNLLYFPVSLKDARRNPKQLVYGVEIDGKSFAVTDRYLQHKPNFDRAVGGYVVRFKRDDDGFVSAINQDTQQPVAITRLYWFAWYAFHPRTELLE
ncbi:DUF3179 domain-containing protein [bacterium SCSIO 12696]|nr:DUF3179 domain-containing protein [bacterium SCSIO 12696]